jgi:PAS domain S-box-containing protein
MVRTPPVTNRSITRQAATRLVFGLGLLILLVAISTLWIYRAALDKAARERAADLADFYQARLAQLEREWELQSKDFRVRIETTRFLEAPESAVTNLQAFMTIQGTNRRFQYMLVENAQGAGLFHFGAGLDLLAIPLSSRENGWYLDPSSGDLYRVFVEKIWLGAVGTGRVAFFYHVNNALLRYLASPGITLTALYHKIPVASSRGQSGLQSSVIQDVNAEWRDIFWSGMADGGPSLRIEAPVKVLFSAAELAIGVSIIPILDGLILWFVLGLWLMRNARRINELGGAVNEFSAQHEISDLLQEKIRLARGRNLDEIHQVADALESLAQQSVAHERERRQKEALKKQKDFMWQVIDTDPNQIFVKDDQGRFLLVNQAMAAAHGMSPREVVGKKLTEMNFSTEMVQRMLETDRKVFEEGREITFIEPCKFPDGRQRWLLTVKRCLTMPDGTLGVLGIAVDITEQKLSEMKLAESYQELQQMTFHLETAREDERTRIARELHDEMGATLAAMKMRVAWLASKIPRDLVVLSEEASEMSGLVSDGIQTMRHIVTKLRPSLLEDVGLVATIEAYVGQFRKNTNIECILSVPREGVILEPDQAAAIFRILQESLSNVAKHAQASKVEILFARQGNSLVMTVRDNGIGFVQRQGGKSFGLLGIRERALMAGGKAKISSLPGKGTKVLVSILLPSSSKEAALSQGESPPGE